MKTKDNHSSPESPRFWSDQISRHVEYDEARQLTGNLVSFVRILREWDQAERKCASEEAQSADQPLKETA